MERVRQQEAEVKHLAPGQAMQGKLTVPYSRLNWKNRQNRSVGNCRGILIDVLVISFNIFIL